MRSTDVEFELCDDPRNNCNGVTIDNSGTRSDQEDVDEDLSDDDDNTRDIVAFV